MAETPREVYTLMVELGRREGDGLPEDCDGAALLCYAAARSEKEAVDETVAVLRQAELAPLTIEVHGSRAEREAEGQEISPEDQTLMDRALAENAVIVAQMLPFHDEDDRPEPEDQRNGQPGGPVGGDRR